MESSKRVLEDIKKQSKRVASAVENLIGLTNKASADFKDSELLEEIEEDEDMIEHFDRNIQNLEEELGKIIDNYNSSGDEDLNKILDDVAQLSKDSIKVADRYSHLPKRFSEAAIEHEDPDTARASLKYFMKIEHLLELVEELTDQEDQDSISNERSIEMRKHREKVRNERKKIEREKRHSRSKMDEKGLLR